MVTTKHCAWGTCKNDARLPHLLKRNSNNDNVFFVRFPGPKRQKEKRERWIKACHRGDVFICTKDSYVCSLHFVGENGPTDDYPDPISAISSYEKVSFIYQESLCRNKSLWQDGFRVTLFLPLGHVMCWVCSSNCLFKFRWRSNGEKENSQE